MSDLAKHPRLTIRKGRYYFRAKVPVDLLEAFAPAREVTYSLGTSNPKEALVAVRVASVKFDQDVARRRGKLHSEPQATISDAAVEALVADYTHRRLQEDEEVRLQGTGDAAFHEKVRRALKDQNVPSQAGFGPGEVSRIAGMSDREFLKTGESINWVLDAARTALARGDLSFVEDEVEEALEAAGTKLVAGSDASRKVSAAFLKANVKVLTMLRQRQDGEVIDTPQAAAPLSPIVAVQDGQGITFTALWDTYRREKRLLEKTARDFGTYVVRFTQVVGDLPVADIKKGHVRAFKDAMLRVPSRIATAHKGLPVPDLLRAVGDDPAIPRLSVQTVNDKALGAISAILGYAVTNGYRDDNPATGLKATGPGRQGPSRLFYSGADLEAIFSSPVFVSGARPKGGGGEAAKWLPLLALYTGARLEELGRLEFTDVGVQATVPFIFIHGDDKGRRVKTDTSRRRVPIHNDLVRLGFLAYVEEGRLRKRGVSLFPDLQSQRSAVTAAFSSWWGRYSDTIGITDGTKVFHSFRHLFKRRMRDAGVAKALIDALQGHKSADVADSYGLDEDGIGISLPILQSAIAQLGFPGLNLDHLYV
jgi:integrase